MEKDRIKSLITDEVEIAGRLDRKTKESMDLYPLMADGDRPLLWCRNTKKSATLGKEGREIECPCAMHQRR